MARAACNPANGKSLVLSLEECWRGSTGPRTEIGNAPAECEVGGTGGPGAGYCVLSDLGELRSGVELFIGTAKLPGKGGGGADGNDGA